MVRISSAFGLALAFLSFFFLLNVSLHAEDDVRTVPSVELSQYVGLWHEVARIPNRFQDDIARDGSGFSACRRSTASYVRQSDESISVENRCIRTRGEETREEIALGRATVVEGSRGAKLEVNFTGSWLLEWLGIGNGNYWILALGPLDEEGLYSYSLVGSPDRRNAWILAREGSMADETLDQLLDVLVAQGFDTSNLVFAEPR